MKDAHKPTEFIHVWVDMEEIESRWLSANEYRVKPSTENILGTEMKAAEFNLGDTVYFVLSCKIIQGTIRERKTFFDMDNTSCTTYKVFSYNGPLLYNELSLTAEEAAEKLAKRVLNSYEGEHM